jgi:hypothetical protein
VFSPAPKRPARRRRAAPLPLSSVVRAKNNRAAGVPPADPSGAGESTRPSAGRAGLHAVPGRGGTPSKQSLRRASAARIWRQFLAKRAGDNASRTLAPDPRAAHAAQGLIRGGVRVDAFPRVARTSVRAPFPAGERHASADCKPPLTPAWPCGGSSAAHTFPPVRSPAGHTRGTAG